MIHTMTNDIYYIFYIPPVNISFPELEMKEIRRSINRRTRTRDNLSLHDTGNH